VLRSTLTLAIALLAGQVAPPPEGAPTTPALRRLLADDGIVDRVATNFSDAGSPLWVDGALVFTDAPRNQVLRLQSGQEPAVVDGDSGGASAIALDGAMRLVTAERGRRRIVRREDGESTVLLDQAAGEPLLGLTDLALASDGTLFVADQAAPAAARARGRVIKVPTSGAASVVVDDLPRPSGIAIARDGTELYVVDAALRELRAYPLGASGVTGPARRLTAIVPWKRGVQGRAGGITLDAAGRLYLAGPGGIWVLDRNGGRLGVIATPETPSDSAFGDADGRTLYITAETSIYKVRLNVGAK
jgi:sugar lactone lactonase YvrE